MEAYKRITEVREGQITNETKVLAVDTDGVKQIPPDALGAVKTVNGTQPDEHGNIEILGLPDGASPCQQLVTDADGNMAWENKTHYAHSELIVVLPEAKIYGRKSAVLNQFSQFSDKLSSGHEYTVVYNGTEYKCTPQHNDVLFTNVLGNASLADVGEDTGEPFFFTALYNSEMTFVYFAEEGDHVISINDGIVETVVPFDKKYLPPEVTADIEKLSNDKPYQQLVTDANGVATWINGGYVKQKVTFPTPAWNKSSTVSGTACVAGPQSQSMLNGLLGRYIKVSEHVPAMEDFFADSVTVDVVESWDVQETFDGAYSRGVYVSNLLEVPYVIVIPGVFKLPVGDYNGTETWYDFWEPGVYVFMKSSDKTDVSFECPCYIPMSEVAIPHVQTAQPGQTIVVKSVDENGKPTEWEAADMTTGDDSKVLTFYCNKDTNNNYRIYRNAEDAGNEDNGYVGKLGSEYYMTASELVELARSGYVVRVHRRWMSNNVPAHIILNYAGSGSLSDGAMFYAFIPVADNTSMKMYMMIYNDDDESFCGSKSIVLT